MLEIKVDNGCIQKLNAAGDLIELVTDFAQAIGQIYTAISDRNSGAASAFRAAIQGIADDAAPTWTVRTPGAAIVVVAEKEAE